jgi:hypothetical protein
VQDHLRAKKNGDQPQNQKQKNYQAPHQQEICVEDPIVFDAYIFPEISVGYGPVH